MTHQKITHGTVHDALIAREGGFADDGTHETQALFCPFYVPLRGVLGGDWGAVVSPASAKFGRLVFEHDGCGCPEGSHGFGHQRTDEWLDRKATAREWEERAAKMRKEL